MQVKIKTKSNGLVNFMNNSAEPVYEVLEKEIEAISKAMKAFNNSRLTRKTIITLIHDSSKINKKTIEIVLNNLEQLEKTWLKPKKE